MNRKYTLSLFAVFVALAAAAYYAGRDREPVEMTAGTATPTPEPMYTIAADDVQEIDVSGPGDEYVLRRAAGGWEVDGEKASEAVDGLVTRLAEGSIKRELPLDRNPSDYGFATPTLTVTIKTKAGDTYALTVGDDTPVESSVYLRLNGEAPIRVMAKADISTLRDWLTDPPLAPTATPTPTATGEGAPEATASPEAGAAGPPSGEPGEATVAATPAATPEATAEGGG